MRATMLLADHAQVADGKLFVSGGGWTWTVPGTPFGIGLLIQVPWDRLNLKHHFRLALIDADGEPVNATGPEGDQPIQFEGEFVGGRPAELQPGTPLTMPVAFNLHGVPLEPQRRYRWDLTIDDESREEWTLAFSTRSAPPQAQAKAG